MADRVTVLGAYGYTGKLICDELKQRGIPFGIAGRNRERLEDMQGKLGLKTPCILTDVRYVEGVAPVLKRSDIIINCAGPFAEESGILAEACARDAKIYLDICGELPFVKWSFESLSELAQHSGGALFHSCAYESMPGDLLLSHILRGRYVRELNFFYESNSYGMSPGTRITAKLSRLKPRLCLSAGQWTNADDANGKRQFYSQSDQLDTTCMPYPLPDVAFATFCRGAGFSSCFLLTQTILQGTLFDEKRRLTDPLKMLDTFRNLKSAGPSEAERLKNRGRLYIHIGLPDGSPLKVKAETSDPYGITARAMALCVRAVLEKAPMPGVHSPSALFRNHEAQTLEWLGIRHQAGADFELH